MWQKGKCRRCDDGARSKLNSTTSRSEKLRCSSVDEIVALIVALREAGVMQLQGWALDELKAYRQIPILPSHRRYAAVALMNPKDRQIYYYRVTGRSFVFTSAVYNYTRRPALMQHLLTSIFQICTLHYYDDRFGVEPESTVESAAQTTQAVFDLLGILIEKS